MQDYTPVNIESLPTPLVSVGAAIGAEDPPRLLDASRVTITDASGQPYKAYAGGVVYWSTRRQVTPGYISGPYVLLKTEDGCSGTPGPGG